MTVTTSITIWQDLAEDHQWRVDLEESAPGTRNLQFGPFATREEAHAWIAAATTVPLPVPAKWVRSTVDGLRDEFWCTIDNEVPA